MRLGVLLTILTPLFVDTIAFGANNSAITYQGRIVKPDGSSINSMVNFRFTLRSPTNCVLWSEDQTLDLRGANGAFSAKIGDAGSINIASGTHAFATIFSNSKDIDNLADCDSGAIYSPGLTDDRTLHVSFNAGDGTQELPVMSVKSVPFAREAASTLSLAGVRVSGATPAGDQVLRYNSVSDMWEPSTFGAGGTVTNVGLDFLGGIFNVTGGPVTTNGTFTVSLQTQNQNTVFAAPLSGSGAPGFRLLTFADIAGGTLSVAHGGTGLDGASAANGQLLIGNGSGFTLGSLTAGSNVTITNGSGAITISATNSGLTHVSTGDGLTGGPILNVGTISLSPTGVTAGTVGTATHIPQIGFDIFGRIVSVGSIAISVSVDASSLNGTLGVAQGGTGLDGSAAPIGSLLVGNGSGFTLGTLTWSNGMVVTNSAGTINLSTNAQTTNAVSSIVARDSSGNFAANKGTFNSIDLSNAGSLVTLSTPMTANYSMILPVNMGSSGQLLSTDGTGNLSWVNAPSTNVTFPLLATTLGSMATPAYSFSVDSDTGMFSPGANTLAFSTYGTTRLNITETGAVGIGTNSPINDLHISRSSPGDVGVRISNVGSGWSSLFLNSNNRNYELAVGGTGGGWTSGKFFILDYLAGVPRFSIDPTGGVSIGTLQTSAPAELTVYSPDGGGVLVLTGEDPVGPISAPFMSADGTAGFSSSALYSFWYQSGTGLSNPALETIGFTTDSFERMRITNAGDVGVGTSTPSALFDVNGTSRSLSHVLAGAGTITLLPPLSGTTSVRFPSSAGSLGQVLTTDGSGNLSWGTVASGGSSVTFPLLSTTLGSVGTPVYSFLADSDTGLWSPGANTLAISTGGTARISINSSGHVGIGTGTPLVPLQVVGEINASGPISATNAGGSYRVTMEGLSGEGIIYLRDSSNNITSRLHAAGDTYFNGGNVGIGTSSPQTPLSIERTFIGSPNLITLSNPQAADWGVGSGALFTGSGSLSMARLTSVWAGNTTNAEFHIAARKDNTLRNAIKVIPWGPTDAPAIDIGDSHPVTGGGFSARLVINSHDVGTQSVNALALSNSAAGAGGASNGIGNDLSFYTETSLSESFAQTAFIRATLDDASDNSKNGSLRFATLGPDALSATKVATEKMRITSSGQVGIGTTSISSGSQLEVAGGAIKAANQNEIRFGELISQGGNFVGLRAPGTLSVNTVWTLPAADGSNGQVLMTDGTGNLSWGTVASGGSSVTFPLLSTTRGSVGTPAYSFSGDSDTGLWSPGANTLAISTGGTARITFANNGYIGIGTTDPEERIDVRGSYLGQIGMYIRNTSGASGAASMVHLASDLSSSGTLIQMNSSNFYGMGGGNSFVINNMINSGHIVLATDNTERFRVETNGAVGIGTTSVGSGNRLEVTGGAIAAGNGSELRMMEALTNGTNSVGFRAPTALANNYSMTLPGSIGSPGQVLMTDGTGALSWTTASGGSVTFPLLSTTLGSVATPAYSFSGDTDTGIYSPGDNQLAISTGGTARVHFTDNGNIGFGTTDPQSPLHLQRANNTSLIMETVAGSTSGPSIRLENNGTGGRIYQLYSTGSANTPGAGFLEFRDNTANESRMVINSGGSVGIGTMAPSAKFSVAGTQTENAHFFYDNPDVGDNENGQSLVVHRRAAEGDDSLSLFISADRTARIASSNYLTIESLYGLRIVHGWTGTYQASNSGNFTPGISGFETSGPWGPNNSGTSMSLHTVNSGGDIAKRLYRCILKCLRRFSYNIYWPTNRSNNL